MNHYTIGSCHSLKLHCVKPVMAIVLLPLVFRRSRNRLHSPVNKSYDVEQRRTSSGNSTSKLLELQRRESCVVPRKESLCPAIVNPPHGGVDDTTEHTLRSPEHGHKLDQPARESKTAKKKAYPFYRKKLGSVIQQKDVEDAKSINDIVDLVYMETKKSLASNVVVLLEVEDNEGDRWVSVPPA